MQKQITVAFPTTPEDSSPLGIFGDVSVHYKVRKNAKPQKCCGLCGIKEKGKQVTNFPKRKLLQLKGIEYEIQVNKTGFEHFVKIITHYQPFYSLPIPNSYCKYRVVARSSKHIFVHIVWTKHTHKSIGNLISQFDHFVFVFSFMKKEGELDEEKNHIDG